MAVHLNILLDEELYRRLKAKAPAKRMSAFIAEAVEAKLGPTKRELDEAYRGRRERNMEVFNRGRVAGDRNRRSPLR